MTLAPFKKISLIAAVVLTVFVVIVLFQNIFVTAQWNFLFGSPKTLEILPLFLFFVFGAVAGLLVGVYIAALLQEKTVSDHELNEKF